MSISRFLALGSIAALLLLASCGKSESNEESKPAENKEVTTVEKKQADLFDEYYEEENKADESADEKSSTEELSTETIAETAETVETSSELVEEVTEETSDEPAKTEPDFDPNGRYVAQISCIASEAIAEDVAKKLENSGYPVYVAEVINPTPQLLGTYYRVRVGGFATISAAKYFGENFLLPAGYSYWVDNRSNDNVGIGDYGLGTTSTSMFEDEPVTEVTSETKTETTVDNSSDFTVEPVTKTEVTKVVDEVKAVVDTVATAVKESVDPFTEETTTSTPEETTTTTTTQESTTSTDETKTNNDDWGSSDW